MERGLNKGIIIPASASVHGESCPDEYPNPSPEASQFSVSFYFLGTLWADDLHWSLEWVSLCRDPLRTVPPSVAALCLPQIYSPLFFTARCYGYSFYWHCYSKLGSPMWGQDLLTPHMWPLQPRDPSHLLITTQWVRYLPGPSLCPSY